MSKIKAALIVQNSIAGEFEENFETSLIFIKKAHKLGAKFIVFPEMNLTGYITGPSIYEIATPIQDKWLDVLKKAANDLDITIFIGLAEKLTSDKIFASHLIISPTTFDIYRKIHTSPFEKLHFSSGDQIKVHNWHDLNFGVQLCYDAHFPELSLSMAMQDADVIFIPHASPRGTSEEKYESWKRHLRARAFDNGVYIAACNQVGDNSGGLQFPGITVFIGPDGKVISRSLDDREDLHIIEIDKLFLQEIRSHKMRYFLPHRRMDLFKI